MPVIVTSSLASLLQNGVLYEMVALGNRIISTEVTSFNSEHPPEAATV